MLGLVLGLPLLPAPRRGSGSGRGSGIDGRYEHPASLAVERLRRTSALLPLFLATTVDGSICVLVAMAAVSRRQQARNERALLDLVADPVKLLTAMLAASGVSLAATAMELDRSR